MCYQFWAMASTIKPQHGNVVWTSLSWVGIADVYARLVAGGTIHDSRFF